MFYQFSFVYIFCFLQIIFSVTCQRSVQDVADNYSEMLYKMTEQLRNFTDFTYKNCSAQVVRVLTNNTLEVTETKDYVREMHYGKETVLMELRMNYYPQVIKECIEKFDNDSEDLGKSVNNTEGVCLIFISNVFTLIENPVLYKNITDLKLQIEGIKPNCTNTSYVREADECFRSEIYTVIQPKIREIRQDVYNFLAMVEKKVNHMLDTLHTCYYTIRSEVLIKKVRRGVRNFQKCVQRRNINN